MIAHQQLQFLVVNKYEQLQNLFNKLGELYKPIEEYVNVTKNESEIWQYLTDLVKYPGANWGKKVYGGTKYEERIDAGHWFLKRFKLSLRFFAVTIPLFI